MNPFLKFVDKINQVHFLSICIVFYIFRMVIPYANYIFIPLLFLFLLHFIYFFLLKKGFKKILSFIKTFLWLTIVIILYLFAFVQSHINFFILKDLFELIIVLFISFSFFFIVDNSEKFKIFTSHFFKSITTFSSAVAVLGILKFYFMLRGVSFQSIGVGYLGSALNSDYNFYVLFSFIGFFSVLYLVSIKYFKNDFLPALILIFLSYNILFSFSRRGFTLIVFLFFASFVIIFIKTINNRIRIVFKNYFVIFLITSSTFSIFIFGIPTTYKLQILKSIGIQKVYYKKTISHLFWRYSNIFIDMPVSRASSMVWNDILNSKNPESGWDLRVGTTLKNLDGSNSGIIPDNSFGYKMDKTCNAASWGGNAFSYIPISGLLDTELLDDSLNWLEASVYCYVSEDFDGEWARISAEGGNLNRSLNNYYNLSLKGTWQKLSIYFTATNNIYPSVYLYWSKYGDTSFKNLKGYVIFAHPSYSKFNLSPKDPKGWGTRHHVAELIENDSIPQIDGCYAYKMDSTCNADTWEGNAFSYTNISSLFEADSINNESIYIASVYCFVSSDFDGTWVRINSEGGNIEKTFKYYDLKRKGKWQKLEIEFSSIQGPPSVYLYWSKSGVKDFSSLRGYVMFAYPEYYKINNRQNSKPLSLNDLTKTRLQKSSFVSVFDNLFSKINENFSLNESSVNQDSILSDSFVIEDDQIFFGSRTERWRYAWYLYKNEYNWHQILFGNGFDYVIKFNYKFYDGERMDYPHNPFISALLYSGLIGLIAYIWFVALVFWYYIKYIKYHLPFFICYLAIFYFTFFSANTHFSVPVLSIFSIIPFITRYIVNQTHSKDEIFDQNI